MPFTSKLIADYVEMINGELDNIPIENREEFDLVAQELQDMITPRPMLWCFTPFFMAKREEKSILSRAAQEQLSYVRYCFNNPRDFVQSSTDYPEYQMIFRARVLAKIAELHAFTDIEKMDYIKYHNAPSPGFEKKTKT